MSKKPVCAALAVLDRHYQSTWRGAIAYTGPYITFAEHERLMAEQDEAHHQAVMQAYDEGYEAGAAK